MKYRITKRHLKYLYGGFKKTQSGFNNLFDFFARILKLIIFAGVVILIIYMWPYFDWQSIPKEMLEEYTFLKIKDATPTASTGTTVARLVPNIDYFNIYQNGKVIFTVDKPYDTSKKRFTIDKMIIKGRPDYKKAFLYAGAKIRIVRISESIGLLITGKGAEGPVLRGVDCTVL